MNDNLELEEIAPLTNINVTTTATTAKGVQREQRAIENESEQRQSLWGIIYMLMGSFSFSVMFLLVKWMDDTSTFALVFYRSIIQCAIALAALMIGWLHTSRKQPGQHDNNQPMLLRHVLLGPADCETRCYLTIRGSFGAAAICAWYFGIQHLPLPDAVTLQFTTPPFAAAFAVLWVGEPWLMLDRIGALVCLLGVALIAHPTWLFGEPHQGHETVDYSDSINSTNFLDDTSLVQAETDQQTAAVLVTIAGAAMAGLAYTSVRKIGHSAPAMVMVLYDGALCLPIVLTGSWILEGTLDVWTLFNDRRGLSALDCILVLLMGVTAFGGQWFTNLGLQDETAATATLVTTTQIVWTYLFNLLFLSEPLNFWSFAGTGLILGYMLFVAALKVKMSGIATTTTTTTTSDDITDQDSTESETPLFELHTQHHTNSAGVPTIITASSSPLLKSHSGPNYSTTSQHLKV